MIFKTKLIVLVVSTICGSVLSLDCYRCRSDIVPECSTNPGMQLDVEECPDNDKCGIRIVDKVTHRNCLSSMLSKCPPNDPLCYACDKPLCNSIIFPENRLRCYQCSGSACNNVTALKIPARPCPYYVKEDRCSTNIVGTMNIIRACVSTPQEPCTNICLKCNYDACNNEQGIFNTTCLTCQYMDGPSLYPKNNACKRAQEYSTINGDDNPQCLVTNQTTCSQLAVLGDKVKCFSHHDSNTNAVTRGCSTKMGSFPSGVIKECYGENCNTDCIDLKCNICDSKTDPNCREKTQYLRQQKCPNDTFACNSCESTDGHITRGCGFKETTRDQQCYHCFDMHGCNKNNTRTCYKCTSTQDKNCLDLQDISKIGHELCKSTGEKCVATVTDKYAVRGCATTVIECTEGDPNCKRCEGSLCNTGILQLTPKFFNAFT